VFVFLKIKPNSIDVPFIQKQTLAFLQIRKMFVCVCVCVCVRAHMHVNMTKST